MMKESETSRGAYCPPGTADQVDWQGNITEGNWRADDTSSAALPSLPKTGCHATRFAYEMRDLLAKHFITNGKVPWQESKIMDTRLYSDTEFERKRETKVLPATVSLTPPNNLVNTKRFSSFTKLIRVIAWVLRFVAMARRKEIEGGALSATELNQAEWFWILQEQKQGL
ncbi:hypothetical protein MRX96_039292 [Rhipicephalus microplus]